VFDEAIRLAAALALVDIIAVGSTDAPSASQPAQKGSRSRPRISG
jgi:hypothetical protein